MWDSGQDLPLGIYCLFWVVYLVDRYLLDLDLTAQLSEHMKLLMLILQSSLNLRQCCGKHLSHSACGPFPLNCTLLYFVLVCVSHELAFLICKNNILVVWTQGPRLPDLPQIHEAKQAHSARRSAWNCHKGWCKWDVFHPKFTVRL